MISLLRFFLCPELPAPFVVSIKENETNNYANKKDQCFEY